MIQNNVLFFFSSGSVVSCSNWLTGTPLKHSRKQMVKIPVGYLQA